MNFLQNLLVRDGEAPPPDSTGGGDDAAGGEGSQKLSQDELRKKRLARLGAQESSNEVPKEPSPEPKPASSRPVPTPSANISNESSVKFAEPIKKERAAPAKVGESSPASKAPQASTSPSASVVGKQRDPVNDALVQLLRISLARVSSKDVTYLPLVAAETNSTVLNDETIDAALYGRLYTDLNDLEPRPAESPLRYVIGCMERLPATRRIYKVDENPNVASSIENARKLLINFVVTYFTEPGLFPTACMAKSQSGLCSPEQEFIDLLRRPDTSANFVHLLQTILPEVIAQKCGKQIMLPVLQQLSKDQREKKLETYEYVLSQICCARVDKVGGWGQFIAEILADERAATDYEKRKSFFQISTRGRKFEEESILAPFFSAPTIDFEPNQRITHDMIDAKRKVLANRQSSLKQAVLEICRAGEAAREEMLRWLDQALELNSERSKDRPDESKATSEGFAINICAVLLHLCEPFLSLEKSAAALPILVSEAVDCMSTCRAFAGDITQLGKKSEMEEEEGGSKSAVTPAVSGKKDKKKFKFQTKAFVLAMRAVDLGPIVSYRRMGLMHRQLRFVRNDEGEEGPTYKKLIQLITVYVAHGFEPTLIENLLSFQSLVAKWFMTVQFDLNGEGQTWNERAGLITDQTLADMKLNSKLVSVPEFVVSNIAEVYVQVGQTIPDVLNSQGTDKLKTVLDMFIAVIAVGDSLVPQPHVRANMGDAIFYAFLPEEAKQQKQGERAIWGYSKGVKEMTLETSALSRAKLVPALMRLYGDVQVTGYYQVAAHRQLITKVLGYLWVIEQHRPAFRSFAQTSLARDGSAEDSAFVKLANGILNQTNSNVAESLAKLREIRQIQQDMKNAKTWSEMPEDIRNQKTVLLDSNEKEVAACLMMANDATDMLCYLSTDPVFVQAFTVPALRARLVDMLCSILSSLGSPKAAEFKIDNPEKYNFFPKKMMEEVFETLLNCAKVVSGREELAEEFIKTVARSAYYDYANFVHAAKIIRKHGIVNDTSSLDVFTKFVDDVEKAKLNAQKKEQERGEPPEEFVDSLMQTVMEDPVILPSSKMVVDRSTIMHHLLQSSTDPFDRSPLDASQLKEDTELKLRIQQWLSS